ncbi:multiple sugar transport system permease protein [Pullulanibacillus pueri]|uniref:Spermidine/putrescine ABC transporter permease n=1 Tax=Pullulanibacillus pueri TaxID=1437324 RepID=A0A8J2ZYL1_9BACL|nr:sugar ABC transporter permease [Pullulanibacillus pueri]MBM7682920.1 multiple sugar transport system permease protein [Pullulanibacillus pueri]GGH84785.1 spermidine/putrescine ABC transporter permease [Pullulanibacillus pueri]
MHTEVPKNTKTKRPRTKKTLSLKQKEGLQGYIFISPWIIGFLCITAGPLLFSLYGSFTNYDVTSRMDFIGLSNYIKMVTNDDLFWISLGNTIYYVVISVPLTVFGAVLLAVLLNQGIPGLRIFRTIYYLPTVLSGVGVYLLWMQLLNPTTGLVNTMLSWIGIQGPAWLLDPNWTKPALIFMKFWSLGGGMLLYLASLQGVPKSLYEAAEIDGANAFKRFIHITLPMISPVIFFEFVTGIIGGFQVFQEAYVMTDNGDGGPANSLVFFNLHMWDKAFNVFDMGYAMAMSWVLFIIILILTLINLKLAPRWVHYQGGDQK